MTETPYSGRFPTTCWSRIVHAGDPSDPEAREALEALCRDYWYRLYYYSVNFLRTSRGRCSYG
jgi:hypothetical protein